MWEVEEIEDEELAWEIAIGAGLLRRLHIFYFRHRFSRLGKQAQLALGRLVLAFLNGCDLAKPHSTGDTLYPTSHARTGFGVVAAASADGEFRGVDHDLFSSLSRRSL